MSSLYVMDSPVPFARLPPEIRAMVWHMATVEEASSRSVFVHHCIVNQVGNRSDWDMDYRVKPSKPLKSQIMAVCRESRSCALKIYTMQLPVFFDLISSINCSFFALLPCHGPEYSPEGTLYLSPLHDNFVTGIAQEIEAIEMVHEEYVTGYLSQMARNVPMPDFVKGFINFRNYITSKLTLAQRQAVRKVTLIADENCDDVLHTNILDGFVATVCACGVGDNIGAFDYRVVSTPWSDVFPDADQVKIFELDVDDDNAWLLLALRLVWGTFAGPWF